MKDYLNRGVIVASFLSAFYQPWFLAIVVVGLVLEALAGVVVLPTTKTAADTNKKIKELEREFEDFKTRYIRSAGR